MSATDREAFLARLRAAAAPRDRATVDAELAALGAGPRALPAHDDRRVALLATLLRNQASVDAVVDREAAVRAIGRFVAARHGVRRLVAGQDPRLAALPWRDAGLLPRFGDIEAGEPIAVGFAELGIAETGSVVLTSGRGKPARNALLPDDHIVLLAGDDVIDDLDALWPALRARLGDDCRPRAVQLVSGPSSTADIALQMVYGAHGPQALHVILIDQAGPDCLREARALAAVTSERGS